MITVKKLKELLKDIPDNYNCYAYEGEDTGLMISSNIYLIGNNYYFIAMDSSGDINEYTEGFKK